MVNDADRLFAAIKAVDVATVRHLLSGGVPVNQVNDKGLSPLLGACIDGNREIVELLLFWGADVNAKWAGGDDITPLILVTAGRHTNIVNLLLASSPDIDVDAQITSGKHKGVTALSMAVVNDDRPTVKTLLKYGADANLQYEVEVGGPLLIAAVTLGFRGIVIELLKGGASTDVEVDSFTALLFAAESGREDIVKL